MLRILFVISLLLFSSWGRTQTIVPAGNVSGVWSASNSPYLVQGLIVVQDGQTLTIEPGTTIQFAASGRIEVEGSIIAEGSAQNQILFTPINISNSWDGIFVSPVNSLSDSSIFLHCTIEHINGISLLSVENFSKIRIEYCVIQYGTWNLGAGISLINSNAVIRNNLIQHNTAPNSGGGINMAGGNPLIQGNTFFDNYAGGAGGGINVNNSSDPFIVGNTFVDNEAYIGGAIGLSNFADPLIANNLFDGNSSFGYGGGAIVGGTTDPIITENVFLNNSSSGSGGVCYFFGSSDPIFTGNYYEGNQASSGGVSYFKDQTNALIINETFAYNSAGSGGAIYFASSAYAKVEKCKFSNNVVTVRGGAVYSTGSVSPDIVNCTFTNNSAYRGGAISCNGGASNAFNNCTFANNHATNNGGVIHIYSNSSPSFTNCIFEGNTSVNSATIIFCETSAPLPSNPGFVHCNIEGGQTGIDLNGNVLSAYSNNIDAAPQFLSPSGGSGDLFDGVSADWRLAASSPCYNAGTPDTTGLLLSTTDLAGVSRVILDTVDIGAYEILSAPEIISQTSTLHICSGDSAVLFISSGGIPPLTYQWQLTGVNIVGATNDSLIVAGIPGNAGDYVCIISNSYGTDTSDIISVSYSENPVLNSLGADFEICTGDTTLLTSDIGPFSYNWNNGLGWDDSLTVIYGGTYFYTVTDTNMCSTHSDSITITFNALPIFDLGADIESCDSNQIWIGPAISGVLFNWNNGQTYADSIGVNTTGGHSLVVVDTNGCSYTDSIYITFYPPTNVNLMGDTLCEGQSIIIDAGQEFISYNWNNGLSPNQLLTVSSTGNYFVEVIDTNNCTGVDTAFILFNTLPIVSLGGNQQVCYGDSLLLNPGMEYESYDWNSGYSFSDSIYVTVSGQWFVEVVDSNGCMNSDTVVVTVFPESLGTDVIFTCDSYTWIDGNTYTSDNNTATVTLTNIFGCDSVVTLDLTVNYSSIGTDVVAACDSFTWIDGITYTSSTTGTHIIPSGAANGCDSTVSLNLTIISVNTTITNNDPQLIADQGMSGYQWLDCVNNFAPIIGETNSIYNAQQNGSYAVEVELNGCTDTSECVIVNSVSIDEISKQNWIVYPNPTDNNVYINFQETIDQVDIEITTTIGQTVFKQSFINSDIIELSLGDVSGVYFIRIQNKNKEVILPLVKM